VGTAPPLKFLPLGVSHRNRLGCLEDAVPDFFEKLQPIGTLSDWISLRTVLMAAFSASGSVTASACQYA